MKKYIENYIKTVEKYLENASYETIADFKREHLIQIGFIQHERLIHLLVTIFVGILLFIAMAILFANTGMLFMLVLVVVLFGLVIPYMFYYYYIENATQKLYSLYNILCEKENELKKVYEPK